jgi:hypothetical protein
MSAKKTLLPLMESMPEFKLILFQLAHPTNAKKTLQLLMVLMLELNNQE